MKGVMDIMIKRVSFTVWTNTPGWFVDEAFKNGLAIVVQPDMVAAFIGRCFKCNVNVYGLTKLVDDFIKYVEEQNFDVSIEEIEEMDQE